MEKPYQQPKPNSINIFHNATSKNACFHGPLEKCKMALFERCVVALWVGVFRSCGEQALQKVRLCPNGWKKSHCMLARKAPCSQLRLGDAIGRNVHTARSNGRKFSYRPTLDCSQLTTCSHAMRLFPPIWTQNVVCTSSDMVAMWLVWIPPSLRSGGYTSHSSQSLPCRPWYTIYYFCRFLNIA